jgi:hypothetical protein
MTFDIIKIIILLTFPLIIFFLMLRNRGATSFQRIRNLVNTDETHLSDLRLSFDEINKVSKRTYTLIDTVAIKLNGYDFDLVKCSVSSVGTVGGYAGESTGGINTISSNYSKAIYILSTNKSSTEIAKKMQDLLKLYDASETIAIFSVKDFKILEKRIKKELKGMVVKGNKGDGF